MSPSGHWNTASTSNPVAQCFFGEIQNEPFGALKPESQILLITFSFRWNTKWALRGIETILFRRGLATPQRAGWNTKWALRGIETWRFYKTRSRLVCSGGEIQNEPFGALKLINLDPNGIGCRFGEIQNEPFGALKRDTGQVADEPDLVVKYKMSPSGHWNCFWSTLFGLSKLVLVKYKMSPSGHWNHHAKDIPLGVLTAVKYKMSPSGHWNYT